MLHDLLNRDISNASLNDFPRTQALLDQIISSMSPVGRFVFEGLKEGSFSMRQNNREAIPTEDLYERYKDFCSGLGVRFKMPMQEFGKKLKRYLPGVTKKRLPSSNGYREKDGRSNHYVFPSLEVCRRDFEREVRMKIDWDE